MLVRRTKARARLAIAPPGKVSVFDRGRAGGKWPFGRDGGLPGIQWSSRTNLDDSLKPARKRAPAQILRVTGCPCPRNPASRADPLTANGGATPRPVPVPATAEPARRAHPGTGAATEPNNSPFRRPPIPAGSAATAREPLHRCCSWRRDAVLFWSYVIPADLSRASNISLLRYGTGWARPGRSSGLGQFTAKTGQRPGLRRDVAGEQPQWLLL